MPASICRRPSRRTAASSSSPPRVNGETSAVPTPVNAFASVFSNVLDPLDMCDPPDLRGLPEPADLPDTPDLPTA